MGLKNDKARAVDELTAKTKALLQKLEGLEQEQALEQSHYRELLLQLDTIDKSLRHREKVITNHCTLLGRAEQELFEETTIFNGL